MRIAFKMKLLGENSEEYKKRHNPVWSDLKDELINHGVKSYTIFLDKDTNDLFGYAEIENLKKWEEIANTDVCRRWWDYMSPLMEVNADNSPVSKDLLEVFHIERNN